MGLFMKSELERMKLASRGYVDPKRLPTPLMGRDRDGRLRTFDPAALTERSPSYAGPGGWPRVESYSGSSTCQRGPRADRAKDELSMSKKGLISNRPINPFLANRFGPGPDQTIIL